MSSIFDYHFTSSRIDFGKKIFLKQKKWPEYYSEGDDVWNAPDTTTLPTAGIKGVVLLSVHNIIRLTSPLYTFGGILER